jgi:hypothetical protein
MTITYVNPGALATGSTAASVAHPSGLAAQDLEVLQVLTGHPSGATPSTPAGWKKVAEVQGGDPAAYGVGTGPRRLTVFTREAAATNPAADLSLVAGTNAFIGAKMFALRRSAGTGWRYHASVGTDVSSGTAVSVVGDDSMTWAGGDFALQLLGVPTSTPSASAEGVAATGVTFGATTERADDAIAVGGTARLVAASATVSSVTGTPNGPPTATATLSGASFAVGAVLRVREATAVVTATIQTSDPPRVLVSVSGMFAEDVVSITVERSASDTLTPLRAATDVDVTGDDAFVRTDGELPFGVAVSYVVTLTDAQGDEWQLESNTVTVGAAEDGEVLSDAVLGVGVDVQILEWRSRQYDREATVFNVSGRHVVVSGPNPDFTADLVLFTETTAARVAMLDLLDRATGGIVQLRTHASTICLDDPGYDVHAEVDGYVAVLSVVEERAGKFRWPQRRWRMSVVAVDPWQLTLEARGWTYADVDGFFTDQTYAALDAEFVGQTYLALDTRDWGV